MTQKPRIAVILGSTRDSRFGMKPAQWILEKARARGDWQVDLVDLKDYDLPLFNEAASTAWAPSQDGRAVSWQETVKQYDGYIFVTAEYNRSITGSLKNALDQACVEWHRKAFGIVGYGSLGAARAAEHLRTIAIDLHMVSTRQGVHLSGADFFAVHPMGGQNKEMTDLDPSLKGAAQTMLDELDWWTRATIAARKQDRAQNPSQSAA